MPTAPPLGRILAELLGGTRSSPPEAPSLRADRAKVQSTSLSFAAASMAHSSPQSRFITNTAALLLRATTTRLLPK